MAAYYKVDVSLSTNSVTVGAPSAQEVLVTLPLVGPAGATGPQGPAGAGAVESVNSKTGTVVLDGSDIDTSANDDRAAFVVQSFADGNGIYYPLPESTINGKRVYRTTTGHHVFFESLRWHITDGAPITANIIESSDDDEAAFPYLSPWSGDVDKAHLADVVSRARTTFLFLGDSVPSTSVSGFSAAAAAAAPVQSVNGSTGAVTVAVPTASTTTPAALGTAAVGTGTTFARADHVHSADLSDAAFRVVGSADATKKVAFEVDGLTAATTRTITMPNANVTLPNQGTSTTDNVMFQDIAVTNALTVGTGGSVDFADASSIALPAINTSLAIFESGNLNTGTFRAEADSLTDNRTYDLPNASGTIALLETLPAGGTKTYATFTATDNQPPAADFATLDTRNSVACLDFSDTATEGAVFVGIMPEAAVLTSGLIVRLHWMGTATTGDVRWSVAFERGNTDLDSDSFDTATAATATTNGTSGIVTVTAITCTNIDSIAAGDLFRLRVQRLGADGADTMTGAKGCELVVCEVRSAA